MPIFLQAGRSATAPSRMHAPVAAPSRPPQVWTSDHDRGATAVRRARHHRESAFVCFPSRCHTARLRGRQIRTAGTLTSPRISRTRDARRGSTRVRARARLDRSMPTSDMPARPRGKEMRPVPATIQTRPPQWRARFRQNGTLAERPRILPVIERRRPAFVASGTAGAELLALGFG